MRYRSQTIFRIGGYCPPYSDRKSKRSYSGYWVATFSCSPTGLSPSKASLSREFWIQERGRAPVQTPHPTCLSAEVRFVPFPLSVALTNGISIDFFSCGYCDASVFRVPSQEIAFASVKGIPFGDPRFNACMRLPSAYRCLPRPSSVFEPSHPPFSVFVLA